MPDKSAEDTQRLVLEVSRAADEFRDRLGSEQPDWKPLHDAIPIEHCDGFMWMLRGPWKEEVIECYKHGITRRSIHLDHAGRAYLYRRRSGRDEYLEIPVSAAVDGVFCDIEKMGFTRATPYDEAFRLERNRKARDMGWTIIS